MENESYDDWKAVYNTGVEYEAELVRDRLGDAGIPAVIMNQSDHAFNLTVGDMARIRVMVPAENLKQAADLLNEAPLTDAELEAAALAADPFDDEEIDEDEDEAWDEAQ